MSLAEKQEKLLVKGADDMGRMPDQLLECVEAAFLTSADTDLRFPKVFHDLLLDYFCHRIAREPQDLRSHVRRILLTCEHGLAENLFPALLDLFIALGKQGGSLRARMLELSRASLSSNAYNLFREALPGGLEATKVPFASGSLLCQGIEGTLQCLYPVTEKVMTPRDPLVEAREYLEYSQIDEARSVLERAILQQPQPPELHRELLDIYRSTRDQANYAKIFQELNKTNIPLPEAWQELAEFFRNPHV